MAVIDPLSISLPEPGDPVVWLYTWPSMVNGDIGAPVSLMNHADRSVQIEGTLGAAGACAVEGSNDAVNFRVLNDVFGAPLLISAASIKQIKELTRYIRPHITAGDGTTSLTVTVLLRRASARI